MQMISLVKTPNAPKSANYFLEHIQAFKFQTNEECQWFNEIFPMTYDYKPEFTSPLIKCLVISSCSRHQRLKKAIST